MRYNAGRPAPLRRPPLLTPPVGEPAEVGPRPERIGFSDVDDGGARGVPPLSAGEVACARRRKEVGMPLDDRPPRQLGRVAAGVIACAMGLLVLVGLVTGDLSDTWNPGLTRSERPVFFWIYLAVFAATAGYAALLALGVVVLRQPANYDAHLGRRTVSGFAFLALAGAAGSGWFWLSERLEGETGGLSEIAGWIALAFLGAATWPPYLPPGPARAALRAAGTAVAFVAVTMIVRLAA
jgi:hypothetical protein